MRERVNESRNEAMNELQGNAKIEPMADQGQVRTDEPAHLVVSDLSVDLGGESILRGVDLEVPPGETVAVLGPSGCGKTTLLRAVAGLLDPVGGKIQLDGADLRGVAPHARGIGLMFQDHALFPHRDVGANVAFGLRMRGASRADQRRRVGEVLEMVGLGGWEHRRVGSLSGGEAQRVALARSLAPAPRLLMLDEPLGSLDRVLHDRLVDELRALFDQLGISVVYVTHDQREALALADRLTVLDAGRVVQAGEPATVWRSPVNETVARFLGQDVICDVEVAGGVVRAGATVLWRGASIADGSRRLVVRPEAVEIVADAPTVVATVADVVFEGDRTSVLLDPQETALPQLRLHLDGAAPARGDRLGIRILPAGTSMLAPDVLH